jgi:hypothetical protein
MLRTVDVSVLHIFAARNDLWRDVSLLTSLTLLGSYA